MTLTPKEHIWSATIWFQTPNNTSRFAPNSLCFAIESCPPEKAYLYICKNQHKCFLLNIFCNKFSNMFISIKNKSSHPLAINFCFLTLSTSYIFSHLTYCNSNSAKAYIYYHYIRLKFIFLIWLLSLKCLLFVCNFLFLGFPYSIELSAW